MKSRGRTCMSEDPLRPRRNWLCFPPLLVFLGGSDGKVSAWAFNPWVRKIWRRQWQPSPVFLPGKSHGRRSLVGYSPWGHKESDTTKRLHFPTSQE